MQILLICKFVLAILAVVIIFSIMFIGEILALPFIMIYRALFVLAILAVVIIFSIMFIGEILALPFIMIYRALEDLVFYILSRLILKI